MTTPLTLEYVMSTRDTLAVAQLYQSTTKKHRLYQAIALVLVSVAAWQGFTIAFGSNQLLLILIALLLAIDPIPLLLMTLSSFNNPRTSVKLRIDDTGIHRMVGDRTVTSGWAQFSHTIENHQYIVLVLASWNYLAIPRRALQQDGAATHLTQFITTHLKVAR